MRGRFATGGRLGQVGALVVALLLMVVALPVAAQEQGTCHGGSDASNQFSDVGDGSAFCVAIAWLADEGVTTGYPDGTFGPSDGLTRGQMAAFLYRYAGEPDPADDAPSFTDVAADSTFSTPIAWLAGEGVTTGYPDGTFGPSDGLTRGQMAAFLYRYAGEPYSTGSIDGFVGLDLTRDLDAGTFSFSLVEDAADYDSVVDQFVQFDPTAGTVLVEDVTEQGAELRVAGDEVSAMEFTAAVTLDDAVSYLPVDADAGRDRPIVDLVDQRVRPFISKRGVFDGQLMIDGGAASGATFMLTITDNDPGTDDISMEITAGTEAEPLPFGTVGFWNIGEADNTGDGVGVIDGLDVSGFTDEIRITVSTNDDYGLLIDTTVVSIS